MPDPIHQSGFTLIELLVVIAIIALLMSIVIPSLAKVKELASEIPCLANQQSFAMGFEMYHQDNEGNLMSAYTWYADPQITNGWVYPPTDYDASGNILTGTLNPYTPEQCTIKREQNGIKKGALWPYIEELDTYHCPADKRPSRSNVGFRSYSMVVTIRDAYGGALQEHAVSKIGQITVPSNKYIIVEGQRMTPIGGQWVWHWNMGSWYFNVTDRNFGEPPANWHARGVSLAYADGHAEKYKWKNQETLEWLENEQIPDNAPASVKNTDDANYFYRNIPRCK